MGNNAIFSASPSAKHGALSYFGKQPGFAISCRQPHHTCVCPAISPVFSPVPGFSFLMAGYTNTSTRQHVNTSTRQHARISDNLTNNKKDSNDANTRH
ncbi:hypothetical protein, partial [Aeromonas enteropelogenes]|uniref:hypothetical protein n=1 Tax=Aeromonas enteropelogenes TaxID=29489 RepID=UPI003B9F661D